MLRLLSLLLLVTIFGRIEAKTDPQRFPEEECYLKDLRKQAKKLRANDHEMARAIIREINSRVRLDKKIQALTNKSAEMNPKVAGNKSFPFDINRTGRQFTGLYINASDVRLKAQNYVLAACPRDCKGAKDYYEAALAQDVAVFVSAIKSTEAKSRYNNFWKQEKLNKISLRDRSRIQHIASTVLKNDGIPQIIETSLLTTYGKSITHLHYDGWGDKRPIPSEKLLAHLLDRISELNPDPEVPVAINCRGGVGRTGTIAVSLYLRRLVDRELQAGKKLDKIKVNIPEVIYTFRNQRNRIIGNPSQLAQLYTVLADYYDQISPKKD